MEKRIETTEPSDQHRPQIDICECRTEELELVSGGWFAGWFAPTQSITAIAGTQWDEIAQAICRSL